MLSDQLEQIEFSRNNQILEQLGQQDSAQLAVNNYNQLVADLNSCNSIVKSNRLELHPAEDDDFEDE